MMTFLLIILFLRSVFFLRATDLDAFRIEIFKPFICSVWAAILIVILLFSCILHELYKRERKQSRFALIFLQCFGTFCQQSISHQTNMCSTRCSIMILFVSSFIIYNFYTSELVSSLLKTKPFTSVTNKERLADSNIPIGFCNSGTIKNFINVRCFAPYLSHI